MTKAKISAIVPVFNEEKTIKNVVKILLKNKLIDEIICINDSSTDSSLEILKSFKDSIILVDLKINKGKGNALACGVKKAKGDIVAFFDADIINLKHSHINNLLNPLINQSHQISIGILNEDSPFASLTGERAFFKSLLMPYLNEMRKKRFGIEIFFNNTFKNHKIAYVELTRLRTMLKYEKYSTFLTIKEYTKEATEVSREIIIQRTNNVLETLKNRQVIKYKTSILKKLKRRKGNIKT